LRLDEIVKENFSDAQILAHDSGIQIKLLECEPLTVCGDQHRLRQLLLNLADNAVKYNCRDGRVTLALRRTGEHAQFSISNTGPGIPEEALPRLFDRFYRVTNNQDIEGSGLGLSIVSWIVSAHNGEIKITSQPAQPTTVTVTLPLAVPRVPSASV
jgi:two-component system phosphate regulon sensor histidine kinase PhoR